MKTRKMVKFGLSLTSLNKITLETVDSMLLVKFKIIR